MDSVNNFPMQSPFFVNNIIIKKIERKNMKTFIFRFFAAAAILLAVTSCSQKELTLDEIITKFTEKSGGEKALNAVKAMVMDAKIEMRGAEVPIKVSISKPDKFKISMDYMGNSSTQCYNSGKGWAMNNGEVQELPTEMILSMKENLESQFKFLNNPLINYKSNGAKVKLLGQDTLNSKKVYKIELIDKVNQMTIIYIDANNFIEVRNDVSLKTPDGNSVLINFDFSEHKAIDKILVPHKIKILQNGQEVSGVIITKIEFLDTLNPSEFEVPNVEKEAVAN